MEVGIEQLWDPQEMWAAGENEGCNKCSFAELGMRLGRGRFGREEDVGKVFS